MKLPCVGMCSEARDITRRNEILTTSLPLCDSLMYPFPCRFRPVFSLSYGILSRGILARVKNTVGMLVSELSENCSASLDQRGKAI